ncbi:MAG: metallophosphoesterase [Candidatus Eisenbacteria bacterium]
MTGRTIIQRILTAGALLAGALLAYAVLGEPFRMTVKEVTIPSPRLARFFDGAVAVHISDLHTTGIGLREKRLLAALEEIDPDYVFITGDYVRDEAPRRGALELLGRIPSKAGLLGVLGNVDYDGSRESCRMCHFPDADGPAGPLRDGDPIRMLRNDGLILERGGRHLQVIGADEIDERNGGPDPRVLLREADPGTPLLVLSHTTYLVDESASAGADLYLAGDTHGGQVAAPTAVMRRVMPDKYWDYRAGRYRAGPLWIHVSHGIGWSLFPIRFGYPPEITVFRFTGEERE